jgi:NAD(P)-dependent dehydrogenase (short-subunit alcohol dehydrogenase family)
MGVINATLACRDSMRNRGGAVVLNISSMAGYLSAPPYLVSKLTVRGLTVAFATELAPDRIRVNAIAPSGVGDAVSLFRGGDAQGRWRLPTELLIGVAEQPGLQVGVGVSGGELVPVPHREGSEPVDTRRTPSSANADSERPGMASTLTGR